MIINIFRSSIISDHILYGDVLQDDHAVGDTFDRFYVTDAGHIEICERTEHEFGFGEGNTFETLHTTFEKLAMEHSLSRFYGNRNIDFYWWDDATEYITSRSATTKRNLYIQ